MKISVMEHGGPKKTGREMHRAAKYTDDIRNFKNMPFRHYYEMVKRMPYRPNRDILKNGEIITRPKYAFRVRKGDCKQKAILIAAWCNAQSPAVPYKFVASSERPDRRLHHVFPIVKLSGKWMVADPTYDIYFLGEGKNLTYWEII